MDKMAQYDGWKGGYWDTFKKMALTITQIENYYNQKCAGLCGLMNSTLELRNFKDYVEDALEPYNQAFISEVNSYWTTGKIQNEFVEEARIFMAPIIGDVIIPRLKHCNVKGDIVHPNSGEGVECLVNSYINNVTVDNSFLWVGFSESEPLENLLFVTDLIGATD